MKYLRPLFLTLACGKTHSTAQKTSNKNPVIKALNLDKLKLYPLELVHLISEENFLHPAKNLRLVSLNCSQCDAKLI